MLGLLTSRGSADTNTTNYITAEELQKQLEDLAQYLGVSVAEVKDALKASIDENTGKIATNEEAIRGILKRLDAIDTINEEDGVESLAEKMKAFKEKLDTLNKILSENGTLATDVLQRIADNKAALNALSSDLQTETKRAQDAEKALDEKITSVQDSVRSNTTSINGINNRLDKMEQAARDAVDDINDKINALKDADKALFTYEDADGNIVEGKVNKLIREANTAQSVELKGYTDKKVANLQSQIDEITGGDNGGSLSDLNNRVAQSEQDISDLKNIVESNYETFSSTVEGIMASQQEGLDNVNQEIEEINNVLNDTVGANDNVVKGLKTRVSDLEAQTGNNASAIAQAKATAEAAMAEAQKAGLKTGIIDGKKAANKFREVLGLAPLS